MNNISGRTYLAVAVIALGLFVGLMPSFGGFVTAVAKYGNALRFQGTVFLKEGTNVTLTPDASDNSITIASSGGSGGYATVQDEGTPLAQETVLDCQGAGITCTPDTGKTVITVPGSGSATITVEEGDTPVSASITILDYGAGFDITESPAGEANIVLDLTEKPVNLGTEVTGTLDISDNTNLTAASPITLTGDQVGLGTVDISDNTNLTASSPITLTGDDIGLGTVDVSSNTNLAVTAPITLTDDTVGLGTVDISSNTNLTASSPITLTGDDIGLTTQASYHYAYWIQSGDVSTTMAVENFRIYVETAGKIIDARCWVNTAPTTDAVIVDVNKNGTTIFTTQANRPEIAASTYTDVSGTPDVATFTTGDYFTIEIDQADTGDTASDLGCHLRVSWANVNY